MHFHFFLAAAVFSVLTFLWRRVCLTNSQTRPLSESLSDSVDDLGRKSRPRSRRLETQKNWRFYSPKSMKKLILTGV